MLRPSSAARRELVAYGPAGSGDCLGSDNTVGFCFCDLSLLALSQWLKEDSNLNLKRRDEREEGLHAEGQHIVFSRQGGASQRKDIINTVDLGIRYSKIPLLPSLSANTSRSPACKIGVNAYVYGLRSGTSTPSNLCA